MKSNKEADNKTLSKLLEVGEVILYWAGGVLLISVAFYIFYILVLLFTI